MKLPKSAQVGPFRYEIAADVVMPDGLVGETDHRQRSIVLAKNYRLEEQSVTLLHEIIHAADEVFKAGLDERQVAVLSCGLAQALGSMGAWPETFE